MLSLFPEFFTYSLIAPFILRIALGGYFISRGIRQHREDSSAWNSLWGTFKIKDWSLGTIVAKIEIVIGGLLFIGLFTQAAALATIVFVAIEWYKKHKFDRAPFADVWSSLFVICIAIAILFLGAGFMAFDLPL